MERMQTRAPVTDAAGAGFPANVHFVGIGGAGVSGLARVLVSRGVRVSGHDRAPSAIFKSLQSLGLELGTGASRAEHLPPGTELVIRSAAVPPDDPQVAAAVARGLPVLKYADALGRLAPPETTLAVAGTHGKTGSSWMLWHTLEGIGDELGSSVAGALPVAGALIGGLDRRLGTNALAGGPGGFFCVEACEYDRTFLRLSPHAAIVTNVEEDHLDYYGDASAIRGAFAHFASRVSSDGLLVLGRDVPAEVEHAARAECWRLGRELEVALVGEVRGAFRMRLRGPGWATPPVQLRVPGHFNAENAALAMALAIGCASRRARVAPEAVLAGAAKGIERFEGVARRFEPWGEVGGIELVHDYAHHPTEVRVTLEAGLRAFPGVPVHVLFQPHQHSRTARFLEEFADSLRGASRVVVADVYGARSHIDGARFAGSPELVTALAARGVAAAYGGDLRGSVRQLVEGLPARAAVLVIGAGDIEDVRDDLHEALEQRRPLRGAF